MIRKGHCVAVDVTMTYPICDYHPGDYFGEIEVEVFWILFLLRHQIITDIF